MIRKLAHHVRTLHRLRKHKEEHLPPWKERWHSFNEKNLGWLELFVEKLIPWLVLILLIIILGEFSEAINFFRWEWLTKVYEFFEAHVYEFEIIDNIIITFFVIDLYFNFFKKATLWSFIKTSFIDILAVIPLSLIFRIAGLSEVQTAVHVTESVQKQAAVAEGVVKTESEAARLGRIAKIAGFAEKIPRFLRLNKLFYFLKDKRNSK